MNVPHETWKLICLARYVINMPDIKKRRYFLFRYEKHHGKNAKEQLQEIIMREWLSGYRTGGKRQ